MDNFVVYAYCREDGTFYYIGKGRPRRPYSKRKEGINPPKDKNRILILHSGLREKTAFDYEEKLILFYGRKDLGTGLLRNMTNGGEGVSGWIPDEEWRRKKSESMSGLRNPFFGKTHTEEEIQKLREGRKGKCVGKENNFFGLSLKGELNPMYGKERPDLAQRNKEKPSAKGTKWFNNGETDKRFIPGTEPDGFVQGRLLMAELNSRSSSLEALKKSRNQIWESTMDGFRGNAANVSRHNKANGWDPDARVRLS